MGCVRQHWNVKLGSVMVGFCTDRYGVFSIGMAVGESLVQVCLVGLRKGRERRGSIGLLRFGKFRIG